MSSGQERALAAPRDRRTVVPLGDAGVGGGRFAVFAGPTRATDRESSIEIGKAFAGAGVALLHNGTTSQDDPHDRPSREEVSILAELRAQTGLPVAAPITDIADVENVGDAADVVQLAGYHMQNYRLLKELGSSTARSSCGGARRTPSTSSSRRRSTSSSRATRTSSSASTASARSSASTSSRWTSRRCRS